MTEEEFQAKIEEAWKEGYRKGNLDGYFGCRDAWKEKFPDSE